MSAFGPPPPSYEAQSHSVFIESSSGQKFGSSVISHQPSSSYEFQSLSVPLNCPPGLEILTQVSELTVKQRVEVLEALFGWETENKYSISSISQGQLFNLFTAKENTDCCSRICFGKLRPFELRISNSSFDVLHLSRPLRCSSCLFPCFLQTLQVFSPPDILIGSISQDWSLLSPKFSIKNESGEVVLRILGPFCTYSLCGDVEFQVVSADETLNVGHISKLWSGVLRETFTDADSFVMTFPIDLDVRVKATLLGALFLIDYMFFEKKGNKESDSLGML